MTTSRYTVLRTALAAAALSLGAFTAPAFAGAVTYSAASTAPAIAASFALSDANAAVQQVKFKKKFFRRGHNSRRHNHRFGRYGHRQHGVAGVGHGRGLTGDSRFNRSRGYDRRQRGGHSGHTVRKGIFPFGFVIVK